MPNPTTAGEVIGGRLLGEYGDVTDLAALVGARVWPSKPTQEATGDHVVFWRNGGGDGKNMSGARRLKSHEMRIECVSTTQAGAEAILEEVVELLDGWQDRDIGVQGCFAVGDRDEATLEDGRQVSGQSFSLWFLPVE